MLKGFMDVTKLFADHIKGIILSFSSRNFELFPTLHGETDHAFDVLQIIHSRQKFRR